jgi:gluconokinase
MISAEIRAAIQAQAPVAIVVMGVSGSGKSTLGALIAAWLGCPFVEGDEYHSPANILKMTAGVPLDDAARQPWLDRLAEVLSNTVRRSGITVAACSALKRSYRDRLRLSGEFATCFLFLNAAYTTLDKRISARTGHYMPASLLDSQLKDLEAPEEDEWSITLDREIEAEQLARIALERIGGG